MAATRNADDKKDPLPGADTTESPPDTGISELINASGHVQELERNFNLLSAAGVGLVVGNVWPAVGGSILLAIFNGGPPGVIYEFIAVSVFYWIIAASLAELASAIPSSAGVYHWASVTPGKSWGRIIGFYAGYWNWLAWVFGAASMSSILANTFVQMYALEHPDLEVQRWHVFVTYLIVTWLGCLSVCFFNRAMPYLNTIGIILILAGLLVTVIVVAAIPGSGSHPPHASSSFVWSEWSADIGYPNGFVFVAGMLNGAYSVGTPDAVLIVLLDSHIAEEVPNPGRNIPIAIGLQMGIGFITGLVYIIAIMYAISDYDGLFNAGFPLAEIYRQATGSAGGAIGLLVPFLLCITTCLVGVYITAGRTLWTLGRDKATPFPKYVSKVSPRFGMPLIATLTCGCLVTVLGCYIAAILPHLLTRRKNIVFGPFTLGKFGTVLNSIACGYMIVWFVIYCFPFALPTDAENMNYACLIWGGLTVFVTVWWLIGARKGYVGPKLAGGIDSPVEHMRKPSVEKRASA
ncbi:putative choline transport protein [Cladophialophora carrionii]|uniref:Putative choline transport protein n=1 Tax=Cladophialophora carrionii TaxID=86049 RepID=A0A1C1CSI4_9EURO|nr:putative choline transport protein [Cladophialophora carrionii]